MKKKICAGKYTWLFLALVIVSIIVDIGAFYLVISGKYGNVSMFEMVLMLSVPGVLMVIWLLSFYDWLELKWTDGIVPSEEEGRSLKRTLAYMSENVLHNKCHLINRMLENTKEYCDYANEAEFVKFVDKSLRNDMIFRCKRLVLTKDVVLGRIDNEREFLPVAILRSEVQSDSFYIEKRKYHRSNTPGYIHMYGILELRLKNGNVVKIHTSEGCGNNRVRQLLTGNKG